MELPSNFHKSYQRGLLEDIFFTLFHVHKTTTDMGYIYCVKCGSPFSSLSEALTIMASKRKTIEQNKVLSKKPERYNEITRVTSPRGNTKPRRCEKCTIIKCRGKIRCLYCGHPPLDKVHTAPNINSPEIEILFENWKTKWIAVN